MLSPVGVEPRGQTSFNAAVTASRLSRATGTCSRTGQAAAGSPERAELKKMASPKRTRSWRVATSPESSSMSACLTASQRRSSSKSGIVMLDEPSTSSITFGSSRSKWTCSRTHPGALGAPPSIETTVPAIGGATAVPPVPLTPPAPPLAGPATSGDRSLLEPQAGAWNAAKIERIAADLWAAVIRHAVGETVVSLDRDRLRQVATRSKIELHVDVDRQRLSGNGEGSCPSCRLNRIARSLERLASFDVLAEGCADHAPAAALQALEAIDLSLLHHDQRARPAFAVDPVELDAGDRGSPFAAPVFDRDVCAAARACIASATAAGSAARPATGAGLASARCAGNGAGAGVSAAPAARVARDWTCATAAFAGSSAFACGRCHASGAALCAAAATARAAFGRCSRRAAAGLDAAAAGATAAAGLAPARGRAAGSIRRVVAVVVAARAGAAEQRDHDAQPPDSRPGPPESPRHVCSEISHGLPRLSRRSVRARPPRAFAERTTRMDNSQ